MDNAVETFRDARAVVKIPSGVAVAAFLAVAIGLVTLGIVNLWSAVDNGFKTAITLNSGIGPYSGKEVISFGTWLVGWAVLHFALRKRDMDVRKWFGLSMALLFVAVVLVWPPVFEGIAHAITGGA